MACYLLNTQSIKQNSRLKFEKREKYFFSYLAATQADYDYIEGL